MKRKTIIFSLLGVLLIAGGIYAYKEYTRGKKDLAKIEPRIKISALELIREFESDEAAANKKYLPMDEFIVEVNGIIREIKKDPKGHYTVVLKGGEGSMSSVQCAMDSSYNNQVATLSPEKDVSIRGVVTGFNADELLGSDVFLSRSVIPGN